MTRLGLANGPNLGRLGQREPALYGTATLAEIEAAAVEWGRERGVAIEAFQANGEGALIDFFEAGVGRLDGAVLNPGALAHYGWALRDCIAALPYPVVEVHLTNVFQREPFRHRMVLAAATVGQITGLGAIGYQLALEALYARLQGGAWASQAGQNLQGGGQP